MRYTARSIRALPLAATLGALCLPRAAASEVRDRIVYDGVEIRPGDVINFLGGGATAVASGAAAAANAALGTSLPPLRYGHTGLYLGVDPQTHQRTFLDYTTDKDRPNMPLPLSSQNPKPFLGRIIPEMDFLAANSSSHTEFDVFRLDDVSRLDQRRLLQEAKRISANRSYGENWFLISHVCASAAAEALARATGQNIRLFSPDAFMQPPFHKLPELRNRSIGIRGALRQASEMSTAEARSTQFSELVPRLRAAQFHGQRHAVRRLLTAEEFARLSELRRQQLLDAYWDYLRTLVGFACSDPPNLRTLNDAGRVPGVGLPLPILKAYVNGNSDRMSRCELEIFKKLLATDGAVPVASLISWGQSYRDTHGPHVVLEKLLAAIKSCGAAIGSALTSILPDVDTSTGRATTSGSSSGVRDPSRSTDRSNGGPREGPVLQQSRGIAASGAWPN